ncbi:hypothetical protein AAMO2058_001187600 [Amorphochlora amoebiformis]
MEGGHRLRFCLEVFVVTVRGKVVGEIKRPAVAFRLGDFPSIVVKQPISKLSETYSPSSSPKISTNQLSLLDFKRGKSCDFEMSATDADNLFANQPLVAILVDISDPRNPKQYATARLGLSGFTVREMSLTSQEGEGHRKMTADFYSPDKRQKVGGLFGVLRISLRRDACSEVNIRKFLLVGEHMCVNPNLLKNRGREGGGHVRLEDPKIPKKSLRIREEISPIFRNPRHIYPHTGLSEEADERREGEGDNYTADERKMERGGGGG